MIGNAALCATFGIVGPGARQVELEVDGQMLRTRGEREADADLAIGDLARGAGVLPLDADGVFALLEPAGVVDDPIFDGLALGQRAEGIIRGDQPRLVVIPLRIDHEMAKPLVQGVCLLGIRAAAGGNRLHALALAVAEQAEGIEGERGATFLAHRVRRRDGEAR